MKNIIRKGLACIDRGIESVVVFLFILMTIVGGMQVFNRFVLNSSLSWSEEFQKFSHIWIIYLTLAIGYERGSHISMRVVVDRLPGWMRKSLMLFNDLLWLVLAGSLIYYTHIIMKVAKFQTTPGLGLRMDYIYFGLLAGGCYLALCVLRNIPSRLSAIFTTPGGEE